MADENALKIVSWAAREVVIFKLEIDGGGNFSDELWSALICQLAREKWGVKSRVQQWRSDEESFKNRHEFKLLKSDQIAQKEKESLQRVLYTHTFVLC